MQRFDYWIDLTIRRRGVFLQAAGIVIGLIVLGTLLWPPVYESAAQILVQDNRAQFLVSPEIQNSDSNKASAVVVNPVSEQDLNSERELVTSLFLVKEAIANVHSLPQDGPGTLLLNALSLPMTLPTLGYGCGVVQPTAGGGAIKLSNHLKTEVIKRSEHHRGHLVVSHEARWSQDFLNRLL